MNSFTAIINKIVKYYCKVLLLRCLQGSSLRLCYLQVALFSCCTCFMLKFFNIEKCWKWTKEKIQPKKTTLHSTLWTCFTFILISYIIFLSLYSFEWLIEWKGTNLLFCSKKKYVCQSLKLLKLESESKFTSTWHKILSISCRYFNYYIENEWTQNKIHLCWRNTCVGITLF